MTAGTDWTGYFSKRGWQNDLLLPDIQSGDLSTSEERRELLGPMVEFPMIQPKSVFENCSTVVLSLQTAQSCVELLMGVIAVIHEHLIVDTTTGAPEDSRRPCRLSLKLAESAISMPPSLDPE
ncbi:MAG: hypothetical protein U0936_11290 [Planctomycetaceae bacterium]